MYSFTSTSDMATKLYTKAFHIGRKNKVKRWKLFGQIFSSSFTYLMRLFGTYIGTEQRAMTPTSTTWAFDNNGKIYTHVPGNVTPLVSTFTPTIGETYTVIYKISLDVTSVTFGGVTLTNTTGITTAVVKATTAGALTITPVSGSDVAVSSVYIYNGKVDTAIATGYYNRFTSIPHARSV